MPALVEKKVALVIGNAQSASGKRLLSPIRDANDIAHKLIDLKFEVQPEQDLDLAKVIEDQAGFCSKTNAAQRARK